MKSSIAVIAFALSVGSSFAVANVEPLQSPILPNYTCTITHVATFGTNTLIHSVYENAFVGNSFHVNRRTGVTHGALRNNYINLPIVLDRADNSTSAYTVVSWGPVTSETSATALVINEDVEGYTKTFMFEDIDVKYFGDCVHTN